MSDDSKKAAGAASPGTPARIVGSGPQSARPPLTSALPVPGDVIWIGMPSGHIVGHEQAKTRPWVVISGKRFHRPFLDLVIAVPLTSKANKVGQFREARILVPENAIISVDPRFIKQDQLALAEHIRSLSLKRSLGKVGSIDQAWVDSIRAAVRYNIT